ncbi:hypothetical protein J6590_053425 [Homalodisca vitripennis]|nr:hypothetical protein J6590_053425 [Homalodisca vitripennis]
MARFCVKFVVFGFIYVLWRYTVHKEECQFELIYYQGFEEAMARFQTINDGTVLCKRGDQLRARNLHRLGGSAANCRLRIDPNRVLLPCACRVPYTHCCTPTSTH